MANRPHHRLIVQKYGGSSLDSPERIRAIAGKIAARAQRDTGIIVIVSAMGGSTDDLLRLANEITATPQQRELDMLLTVGERTTMALLSMALNALGCQAISFTGSQSGIITSASHSNAVIEEIRADRIRAALTDGRVVIVAGFQGVSRSKEITTLGRGGSDTTAVALAAELGAERCEIFSDVSGVYTADPRVVPSARRIATIGYDEMLELAALGAKVLHYRAADIARRFGVPLALLSSFQDTEGTQVTTAPAYHPMESAAATSVTCNEDIVWFHVSTATDQLKGVFERLGSADVRLVHVHGESAGERASVSFIVDRPDAERLVTALTGSPAKNTEIERRDDVASVSVVGHGFATRAGAVCRVQSVVLDAGVIPLLITNSSHSVTCVVPAAASRVVTSRLHDALIDAGGR